MATTVVRPGQIWADNDKRARGRQVRVEAVDDTHATVVLVVARHEDILGARPKRCTRIRLDRFKPTSTGYRLVSGTVE